MTKSKNKGTFVTFEGGEGAGKTTLIESIYTFFKAKEYQLIKTREPGSTILGEEVREIVLKRRNEKVSPYAELCLYLSSRAQHIKEVINPGLAEGKIVLCDRFNDSTIAYQGYARGLGVDKVKYFCSFICEGLMPDITIYLDIDPLEGIKRVRKTSKEVANQKGLDRIESEKISFHQKLREGFHILAKEESSRFFIIDASQSIDDVLRQALEILSSFIKRK